MSCVMVMAGGTGGHVMPALAVAHCLRAWGVQVLWIGTRHGLEAEVAPRAGFEFKPIRMKGVRAAGWMRAVIMPFMVALATLQLGWVMLRRKPCSVLGMGGFVSAPGGLAAGLLRRRLVVHEQNTVAGLANRTLARFARTILWGFPVARGLSRGTWVGNPVRREISTIAPPPKRLAGRDAPMRLLVLGGSQGAAVFNRHLPTLLARRRELPMEVWHQCGAGGGATAIAAGYRAAGISAQVDDFISDMARAYTWCDVVICRAGAMTIAEVCAAGAAAIFVPYPHAADDHQTHNAAYLQSHAAAHRVAQRDFLAGDWLVYLDEFHRDRGRVVRMAAAARRLACPDAAAAVARACMEPRREPLMEPGHA